MYQLYTMPPIDEDDTWTVAVKRLQDAHRAWTGTGYDEEEALFDLSHNIIDDNDQPAASVLPKRLHPFLLEAVNHRIESAKALVQGAINSVERGWTDNADAVAHHSSELRMYENRKADLLGELAALQTTGD